MKLNKLSIKAIKLFGDDVVVVVVVNVGLVAVVVGVAIVVLPKLNLLHPILVMYRAVSYKRKMIAQVSEITYLVITS